MCPDPNQPHRYIQIGIVAWGIGCGDEIPAVYTNVPMFGSWIRDKLGSSGGKYYQWLPISSLYDRWSWIWTNRCDIRRCAMKYWMIGTFNENPKKAVNNECVLYIYFLLRIKNSLCPRNICTPSKNITKKSVVKISLFTLQSVGFQENFSWVSKISDVIDSLTKLIRMTPKLVSW